MSDQHWNKDFIKALHTCQNYGSLYRKIDYSNLPKIDQTFSRLVRSSGLDRKDLENRIQKLFIQQFGTYENLVELTYKFYCVIGRMPNSLKELQDFEIVDKLT